MRKFWPAAAAVTLAFTAVQAATILTVEPNRGSLEGGTYVTIWGSGFNRDGREGSTIAYFGNRRCIQEEYDSTDSKFVCYSPPSQDGAEGWVDVKIAIVAIDSQHTYASCPNANSCRFQYRQDATPKADFQTMGGAAGDIMRVYGQLLADSSSAYRVKVGPPGSAMNCDVDSALYADDSNLMDWSGTGGMRCRLGDAPAGRYNISLEARDRTAGWGQAAMRRRTKQVAPDGSIYHFTQRPRIDSLSYYATGLQAGSELVITGASFSWVVADNEVTVAGRPCTVTSATATQLTCIPAPAESSSPTMSFMSSVPAASRKLYPGGAGAVQQVYLNNRQALFNSDPTVTRPWGVEPAQAAAVGMAASISPDITVINSGSMVGYYHNFADGYSQTLTGFFVPPVSANYSFYVRGDDNVKMALSTDDSVVNATVIAQNPGYSVSFWLYYTQPNKFASSPRSLEAGKPYYFRIQHAEGVGGDWFDVAVRVHTDNNAAAAALLRSSNQEQFSSLPEVQTVQTAVNITREQQTITLTGAQAGKFGLSIGGTASTAQLDWNSAEAAMNSAVYGIGGCGSISSVRTALRDANGNLTGYKWDVSINCPTTSPYPTITPFSISLQPMPGSTVSLTAARTRSASVPLDGSFTLSWNGSTTAAIGYSADASTVRTALMVLPGLVDVDVQSVPGNCRDGCGWQVTFWNPPGQQPLLVADATALSGVGARIVVTENEAGSLDPFYWPMPADWVRVPQPLPAVEVRTRGILAACPIYKFNESNPVCTFRYDANLTASVTSVSATSVTVGDTLLVYGSGFLPASAGVGAGPAGSDVPLWQLNRVWLGSSLCNVTDGDDTMLTCTVSDASAGQYAVKVEVGLGRGFAAVAGGVSAITYAQRVTAVTPLRGSFVGGTVITISGTGFFSVPGDNTVTVGGAACSVLTASPALLTCRSPASSQAGSTTVYDATLVVNGQTYSSSFTYRNDLTPVVTAMTPRTLPSAVSGTVNITVTGVPANTNVSVAFGGRACDVKYVAYGTNTLISCLLVRAPALDPPQLAVAPAVTVEGLGLATVTTSGPSAILLDTGFRVTSMSPASGSLMGGQEITVHGVGFVGTVDSTIVQIVHTTEVMDNGSESAAGSGDEMTTHTMLHYLDCTITDIAADGTSITCMLEAPDMSHWVAEQVDPVTGLLTTPVSGALSVRINQLDAPCSDATGAACTYTFDPASTPVVESTSVTFPTLTLTGRQLQPPFHVWIGAEECTGVTVNSARTSASCTMPYQVADTFPISAHSIALGDAYVNASYTYSFSVTAPVDPWVGSSIGGHLITFTGAGFSTVLARNDVRFAGRAAMVMSATPTQLVIHTPTSTITTGTSTVDVVLTLLAADGVTPQSTQTLTGAYIYNFTATPLISSVAPASGTRGSVLMLRGTGFGAWNAGHEVFVGGAPCVLAQSTWTATSANCTLGDVPAGTHRVLLTLAGFGLARFGSSVNFRSALQIDGFSPATAVGFGGGVALTLTGSGFADPATGGSNTIQLCNSLCTVTAATYSSVTCTLAPVMTSAVVSQFGTAEEGILTGVTSFTTNPFVTTSVSAARPAFDGSVEAGFNTCRFGMNMGSDTRALLTRIRYYPRFRATRSWLGAQFLASNDGTTWTTVATVDTAGNTDYDLVVVNEGWNYIDIVNGPLQPKVDLGSQPVWQYLAVQFAAGSPDCSGMEVQFVGIPVAGTSGELSCPVNITVTGPSDPYIGTAAVTKAQSATSVAFSISRTPTVSRISPNNGTALGGDIITIRGTGFPSATADVSVKLNGMPCTVLTVSSGNTLTCRTTPRTEIMQRSVEVLVAGRGAALYNISTTYFRYLDRWSSLNTWANKEPPVEGDTVVVPPGQAILVDVSPPKLFVLLVQGELVFDRRDLTLDATYILIHGGRFEAGTEAEPFLNKLTITLHGDRYTTIEIPEVGAKGLFAMNRGGVHVHGAQGTSTTSTTSTDHSTSHSTGTSLSSMANMGGDVPGVNGAPVSALSQGVIELHGRPRQRVWTTVATTAEAGSYTIVTSEDVDYEPGDNIVITSSSYDYDEAEELVVASRPNARTIVVTTPLAHTHESKIVPAGQWGHSDVDMRCEVGLLNRNIVVQGDERSEEQLFGAHTGAFHGAVYRVENVELRRCGQGFLLGRYCSHLHMADDRSDSYVRANSIHHSFQRATTIHGTHHLRVQDNFDYFIRGHSIFVEDGVEKWNVIEGNLVAKTIRSYASLVGDMKPASFWTASPTNFWRHNRAAGCTNDGYWLELPGNPHGPSYTPTYCPIGSPVGQHYNNTAHSNGVHGLRIYPMYTPFNDPCNAASGGQAQFFYNFTSWHNGGHGIFGKKNGDLHHVFAKLVENGSDDYHQIKILGVLTMTEVANIRDSLLIGTTDPVNRPVPASKRAIWAPQGEFWYVSGATLVNYANVGAISACQSCESDTEYQQGAFTTRFDRMRFFNTAKRIRWTAPFKDILLDLDGTLSDTPSNLSPATVTPRFRFNDWPECAIDTAGVYDYGHVCDNRVRVRKVVVDGHEPRELDFITLNISSAAGVDDLKFRPKEQYGWAIPLVTKKDYDIRFKSLVDWRTLRLRYSEPEYVRGRANVDEFMRLRWFWIDSRYRNRVMYRGSFEVDALPVGMLPSPNDIIGTGVTDRGNKTFTVLLGMNTNGTDPFADKAIAYRIDVANIQCPPEGCVVPGRGDLTNATKWSDPISWPNGRVPQAGDSVTINATQHIIMDVNPPKLGALSIEGKLEFQDNAARILEADSIVVWGQLQVGTAASPFLNNAEIVLHGVRTSPAVIVDNNLFLGNKVLVVLGKVSLHGYKRTKTWVSLATTAPAGATSISLSDSLTGSVFAGDSIVLTPTEYDINEMETATVASVSGDGRTLTLTAPLQYRHYAGPAASTGAAASIRLAAAVGVLTRNVVVRPALSDASDTYGAHVIVTVLNRLIITPEYPTGIMDTREGQIDARYVEFRNCGKQGMEHASVLFQYGRFTLDGSATPQATLGTGDNTKSNALVGCAFSSSFNYGVVATAAKHLWIEGNVFHRTFRNGIDFTDSDCTNGTIINNLIAGVLRSPDVNAADQTPWVTPQAGIYLQVLPTRMSGNLVAGSVDSAYTFYGEACSGSTRFTNNAAHSSLVGAFLLPTSSTCALVNGFTVWRAAHVGILAVDGRGNVEVRNSVVADSHIGISLNFVASSMDQLSSKVKDTLIIGSSSASQCSASTACRAMTKDDVTATSCGSVYGTAFRHVGLMGPQYTNRGKTCLVDGGLEVCRPPNRPERLCSLPWEKRYGLPGTRNAAMFLEGVTFSGFDDDECSGAAKNRAIANNPTQVDMWVPVTASGITWHNTPEASRFWFGTNDQTDPKCADGIGCDSLNFITLLDSDGSLTSTGVARSSVIGPSPLLAQFSPNCVYKSAWGGASVCPGAYHRAMVMSNQDRDTGFRRLGGLQITHRTVDDQNVTTSGFGPIDDGCAKRFYFGQYPFLVVPGQEVRVMWPATEPGQTRFVFNSPDPQESVVVKFFIQRPYALEVYVGGVKVSAMSTADDTALPTVTDPAGTNRFNPQLRHIWFTMRGGANAASTYVDIVRTPVVQLNLKLAVTETEFFEGDLVSNLATLLQIDPRRIRVVQVAPGSIQVKVEIVDEQPTVLVTDPSDNVTAAASTAQLDRMASLTTKITALVQTGQMRSVGSYPVVGVTLVPPVIPAASANDPVTTDTGPITLEPLSDTSGNGLNQGAIAGIAVGTIIGVLVLAGALLVMKRNAAAAALNKSSLKVVTAETVGVTPSATGRASPADVEVAHENPQWARGPVASTRIGFGPSTVAVRTPSTAVVAPTAVVAVTVDGAATPAPTPVATPAAVVVSPTARAATPGGDGRRSSTSKVAPAGAERPRWRS